MDESLPRKTKRLLEEYGLRPKKRFGQNFLLDQRIIQGIVDAAQLTRADTVVEIGPGLGSLTTSLAQKAGNVLAIEIDGDLITPLEETMAAFPNCKLIQGDILDMDLDQQLKETFPDGHFPYKIVANLPYYITTPIIMSLLEQKCQCQTMILMMQKEVGERIEAKPGTKAYGALSVAVQYYTEPEMVLKVPPSSFRPAPEVDSVVMRLRVRDQPAVTPHDEKLFFQVVRAAFGQRRKTLTNALASRFNQIPKKVLVAIIQEAGIDPQTRGETLGLEEFATLADALLNKGGVG